MGGNKEQKRSTALIDQERQRQSQEHSNFMKYAEPRRTQEQGFADETRGKILGGYENLFKNATAGNDMFGGGGGGGGGYTPQTYTPQTYNAKTYNPVTANAERARLSGYIGESADTARKLAKGGEWDPRIRQGYGNFAETGGYSADDISNIRNRAASTAPAFYDTLRNRMSQRATAAGLNQGSIFGAASDRMTRDSARAAQENALDAELGLGDRIREGKLSGLSGLTGLDTSMNQFRGAGMQGLLGAGEAENQLNMFNVGQGNEMSRFNADTLNEGGRFNTSALNDASRFNTNILNDASMYNVGQANSAAAAGASAAERNRSDKVREYMMGLSGMQDVYGSTPAELARQEQLMLQSRFGQAGNIQENLGLRVQNNPREPSVMDRIMQGAGIAGSIAGAWGSGGASLAARGGG